MTSQRDILDVLAPALSAQEATDAWTSGPNGARVYRPDYRLLEQLLSVPVSEGSASQSGRLAKALDCWVASELRRAGFGADEVWPRAERPYVLPREVALLVDRLPPKLQQQVRVELLRNRAVGPSDARVLGRAYMKQVDVLIAQWSRGPELLVSTKSMVSSFRKNLANRFEEAYGDAKNLRGRFPLCSMGFLFLLRSTAATEPGTLDRTIDMLRKLRAEQDVYDATGLVVVAWNDTNPTGVSVQADLVPADLNAGSFLSRLVLAVLERTPIDMHVEARRRHQGRPIPVEEVDEIESEPSV